MCVVCVVCVSCTLVPPALRARARAYAPVWQITVKIVTEDDESVSDIIVQGGEEEIDRFQKTLDLREKGMVYVKGILE